jgi:hypothetical protein
LHLCYLVAASTGSKLQLFQRWREWEYEFILTPSDIAHFKCQIEFRKIGHSASYLYNARLQNKKYDYLVSGIHFIDFVLVKNFLSPLLNTPSMFKPNPNPHISEEIEKEVKACLHDGISHGTCRTDFIKSDIFKQSGGFCWSVGYFIKSVGPVPWDIPSCKPPNSLYH